MTPSCTGCFSANCACIRIWRKKVLENSKKIIEEESSEDSEPKKPAHFSDRDEQFGFNFSPILFPLHRCPIQKQMLDVRFSQPMELPSDLIPTSEILQCKHGNYYSENLKLAASSITVYNERGGHIFPCKLYYRQASPCKCQLHFDGHSQLLYHVRKGLKKADYHLIL